MYGWNQPPEMPRPPHTELDLYDLSSCLLVVFDACYSGACDPVHGNLVPIAEVLGADCAVGFAGAWGCGDYSKEWVYWFWEALAEGLDGSGPLGIEEALQQAGRRVPEACHWDWLILPDTPEARGLKIVPARWGNPNN